MVLSTALKGHLQAWLTSLSAGMVSEERPSQILAQSAFSFIAATTFREFWLYQKNMEAPYQCIIALEILMTLTVSFIPMW